MNLCHIWPIEDEYFSIGFIPLNALTSYVELEERISGWVMEGVLDIHSVLFLLLSGVT